MNSIIIPRLLALVLCLILRFSTPSQALSSAVTESSKTLIHELQKCGTPSQIFDRVGRYVTPLTDPHGQVASLVLIRLSKQLISLDNDHKNREGRKCDKGTISCLPYPRMVENIAESLTVSFDRNPMEALDPTVEGTKALAILARLDPELYSHGSCQPILHKWNDNEIYGSSFMPHQLSGLNWAYQCFRHIDRDTGYTLTLPDKLQAFYDELDIPFQIIPGCFEHETGLSVDALKEEVAFQVDVIRTTSNQVVKERRQTAWQGDDGVSPFEYSGKQMPRMPWTPLVRSIRDGLFSVTDQYYDGCLLNLYPDGGTAMRYHSDPDQGTLWDNATAVVSVGATRRVAFRNLLSDENGSEKSAKPHNFVVMHGDVMEMVDDCQTRYQHAVKPADNKTERAARSSLVFKRSLKN